MRLEQLEYLIEVAKNNSMMAAAEKLHISQPSLTIAIKQLEQELNITIFHRSRKGTYLTKDGERIYNKALQIMHDITSLYHIDAEKQLEKEISGKVSIIVAAGFHRVLREITFDMQRKYPNIQQTFSVFDAQVVNNTLHKKQSADFILTTLLHQDLLLHKEALLKKYRIFLISQNNIHLLAGKNSLLADKKTISFSTLQKVPLCSYADNEYTDNFLCATIEKHNVKLCRSINTTEYDSIVDYVASGQLYSLITPFSTKHTILGKDCVSIPLKEKIPVSFVLLVNRNTPFSKTHELFYEQLMNYYPNAVELEP